MRIHQNRPLDKFMRFLFMLSSALCIVTYGTIKNLCGTNLCDQRLTRIIRINKSHTEICRFTVYTCTCDKALMLANHTNILSSIDKCTIFL